jgi:hypothetical protein
LRWERGKDSNGNPDPYFLRADGWTICRVNIKSLRIYELWKTTTKERVAERRARTDDQGKAAVQALKDFALTASETKAEVTK